MRYLPNLISILRILLVVPIVMAMLQQRYELALGIFVLAGLSDGLDGFLARRYGWTSQLGAILDPIGDKLMMVSSYLVLGWLGDLPWWLVVLVITRDVVIVTGAVFYRFLIGEIVFEALWTSKLNTAMQILLVLVVLLVLVGMDFLLNVETVLIYLVSATTVLSGIQYVIIWSRRAMENHPARHS